MGWDSLFSLGDKIFDRWFSKDAVKEKRRNKIEKLKAELCEIMGKPHSASGAKHLRAIRVRLAKLEAEAKND